MPQQAQALNQRLPAFQTDFGRLDLNAQKDLIILSSAALSLAKSLAEDGKGYEDAEDDKKELAAAVEELQKMCEAGFKSIHEFAVAKDAIHALAVENVQADDYTVPFDVKYKKAIALNPPDKGLKTAKAVDALQKLQKAVDIVNGEEGDDDDVAVEGEDDPARQRTLLLDPITKNVFDDPHKSTICGHTLSKTSIATMAASGRPNAQGVKEFKCPHVGCKKALTAASFEPDLETQVKVEKYHAAVGKEGGAGAAGGRKGGKGAARQFVLDDDEDFH